MKYWAHSDPDGRLEGDAGSRWQPLSEHLRQVGGLARSLAEGAAPGYVHFHDLAELAGLLHDFGKYSACFQQMIRGERIRCQHAIHGAAIAWDALGLAAPHISHAIAGHHSGLPDRDGGERSLRPRVKEFREAAFSLLETAVGDCPELRTVVGADRPQIERVGSRFDLLTRMLASCLVDADRLDTGGNINRQHPLDAAST